MPGPPPAAPSTPPHPLAIRVSRRELARHQWIWRATGMMVLSVMLTAVVTTLLAVGSLSLRLSGVAVVFTLLGAHLLSSEPPAIGTWRNQFVVAIPYVGAVSLFWVSETGVGLPVSAAIFIAPLASVRLARWQEFAAHLVVATLLFVLGGFFLVDDAGARLAMLVTVLGMSVLGLSCWLILDMAEAQGDELERLVRRDPLTGIGNLRLLQEQLGQELVRHGRTGRPLSVLALDLNGFKALNDTRGHAAGDDLLRDVAAALTTACGPDDTVARQGGDEFCILLPGATPELAVRTANAVRAAVAGLGQGVSTGVGIASYPADAVAAAGLLGLADERLRTDKQRMHGLAPRRTDREPPPLRAIVARAARD